MLRVSRSFRLVSLILFCTLGLSALPAPATATTIAELGDDQLIDRSPLILTGSCDAVRSEWRDGTLVTVAAVSVDRVLKGEHTGAVELVIPGGVDLNRPVPIAVTVAGAPTIATGERVLLFLTPVGDVAASYVITGFSQGKFSIVESPDGVPMVRRDLAGATLAGPSSLRSGGQRAVPLDDLERRIARRATLARPGGAR